MASGDMRRPRRVLPPPLLLLLLLALPGVVATASIQLRNLLKETVTEAIREHCPATDPGAVLASALTEFKPALRDLLKEVVTEAVREHSPAPDPGAEPKGPQWRSSCPSGFVPCAGRCYARLHHAVDYTQAEKDCDAIGAHLAVPRSREQNLCVADLAGFGEVIWLGVTDREHEGVFRGADGQHIARADGHSWGPGQPDNAYGKEHCVHMIRSNDLGDGWGFADWNDHKCTSKFYPMCQLPANV